MADRGSFHFRLSITIENTMQALAITTVDGLRGLLALSKGRVKDSDCKELVSASSALHLSIVGDS